MDKHKVKSKTNYRQIIIMIIIIIIIIIISMRYGMAQNSFVLVNFSCLKNIIGYKIGSCSPRAYVNQAFNQSGQAVSGST
jgi:uncharacterized membrane protein YjdF